MVTTKNIVSKMKAVSTVCEALILVVDVRSSEMPQSIKDSVITHCYRRINGVSHVA